MGTQKPLEGIQILRGLAALAVVFHHACLMVADNGARPALLNGLAGLKEAGAAGVDVFFVISGFIMVYVARGSFGKPGAAGDFWLRRLTRIVPLYWIYTTLMLLLVLSPFAMKHAVFSGPFTLASYLFIPAFSPTTTLTVPQPLLTPGWTLSYEMFFYLIFGLWIFFGKLETLIPFLLGCFALTFGATFWLGTSTAVGAFFGQPLMFEFLFGVVAGYAHVKGWRPGARGALACAIAGGVALLLTALMPSVAWYWRWIFWGLPAGLLVFGAAGLRPANGWIGGALRGLGDASYTLYLQHVFLILLAGGLLKRGLLISKCPPDLLIAGTVVACVAAGWISYQYGERPMNRWIASFLAEAREKWRARSQGLGQIAIIDTPEAEPGA